MSTIRDWIVRGVIAGLALAVAQWVTSQPVAGGSKLAFGLAALGGSES
jgi:hypothetical protein